MRMRVCSEDMASLRMTFDWKKIGAALAVAAGFVLLYRHVLVKLISDWWTDGNYSHGFFIIPIAAYLARERRDRFTAARQKPSALGLVVILGSILVLAGGVLGSELFLTRISILGTAFGIVLFFFGWARLRVLIFPLAFLFLMIPLPAIIFNQITFPLQLLASRFGETTLGVVDIPVLREGNVLILANTTLEVAEACSGIRSLISLLTLGIVFGYFADSRGWVRTFIAVSSVPVAIIANGARVAGTGMAAHFIGPEAAEGFFHEFSGWIIFIAAFAMMLVIQRIVLLIAPPPLEAAKAAAQAA
jgi:exosortase